MVLSIVLVGSSRRLLGQSSSERASLLLQAFRHLILVFLEVFRASKERLCDTFLCLLSFCFVTELQASWREGGGHVANRGSVVVDTSHKPTKKWCDLIGMSWILVAQDRLRVSMSTLMVGLNRLVRVVLWFVLRSPVAWVCGVFSEECSLQSMSTECPSSALRCHELRHDLLPGLYRA
jgi:hypothetical protein